MWQVCSQLKEPRVVACADLDAKRLKRRSFLQPGIDDVAFNSLRDPNNIPRLPGKKRIARRLPTAQYPNENAWYTMSLLAAHLRNFWRLRQHFEHPLLIALLRLGFIKLKYFPYGIRNGCNSYLMLGRPMTSSTADLFVLREVLVEETYRDVLPLLPKKGLRTVDIGANLGSFTIWLSRAAKVEEAFCFEPEPDSFRLLQLNLANNGCGFAHALDKAVGGRSRAAQIALKKDSPGGTNIYHTAAGPDRSQGSAIQVVGFSEWLKQTPGVFDVLKLDCEGSEWEIARETNQTEFARFGAIIAEVHTDPEGLNVVEDFGGLMEARGFRTIRWDRKVAGLYAGVHSQQTTAP